uniref:Serpin domain-containing protein n=1 Tax=Panagrolaimus sp. PS1159 TaxID=55785 RepID=A0AC35FU01_9BILA
MVFLGAKENTAKEIKSVIGNGVENDEEIHLYFSSFLNYISSGNLKEVILESANRLYLKNDFKLLDTFINGITEYYRGEIELVDFVESANVANKINEFVRMMSLDEKGLQYYEDKDCQIVGLPYKGGEFKMYILLPREKYGLQKLIETVNPDVLIQILSKLVVTRVRVKLPQFKIESSFDVKETLQKLGINDAFADYIANFEGISLQEEIKISDIKHKAFIETNEEGTEAAAATMVTMGLFGCPVVQEYKNFIADHSFLFIIADNHLNFFFVGTHF